MTTEPESAPSPETPTNTVVLRFDEDRDDRHQELEAEAHLVQAIPRKGEVVNIENQFHAVTEVVHNYDANGIEVHLGRSGDTPAEAQDKTEPKAENQ
ncbi:hypothetical protein OVA24_05210 [Luteolibacter sp. SL250]|uniref:hypothetical protein n=1 Tax=Luteolibacter sp. SL250 TaxID=2995170 RepID=UPI00226FFBA9|nr:hypothetical protein [Luteolibacter sp. SL250]WAC20779.1 hypothetical protein OVA24_05210 [Luteolibacter sp. SL250]